MGMDKDDNIIIIEYPKKIQVRRKEAHKWDTQDVSVFNTLLTIDNIITNQMDKDSYIVTNQIKKKLSSYKQQDKKKNKYVEHLFIQFDDVLHEMKACEMKCVYCRDTMMMVYDNVREGKQWTIDRIDNAQGHNKDNFYLACLECNLQRRCKSDKKFLFTKQFVISLGLGDAAKGHAAPLNPRLSEAMP